jgi:hypothetical protein
MSEPCGTCEAGDKKDCPVHGGGIELCLRNGCTADAHTRGYCETHYRQRLHTGRYGYRDATKVKQHLGELRALGWTYEQIAAAAGVSTWVPHKLVTGRQDRLLHESETALLAVPAVLRASYRPTSPVGTYRRVEALQWLGWPMAHIAERVGLKPYTLTTMRYHGKAVSYRVALAVKELYGELSHLPGPSKQTATKAKARDCAPPMAWDDETIDNPTARPRGIRERAA